MQDDDLGLTAEDHAFRRAAEAYFDEKGRVARAAFDERLLPVFLSFEEHWRDFFAPGEGEAARGYLATPFELRKAQFERFRRECRAWEISFRHCTKSQSSRSPGGANGNGNGHGSPLGTDWEDLKRRLAAQRAKAEQVREFYDQLDSMLDRDRQRRSHPFELLGHLRALGLPSDASLEDIKKAYKRLAMINHPDRQGDVTKMIRINDAYRAIMSFYKVAVAR